MVDKPEGLTSHDVVAVARRALAQHGIGHTGTLDPMATGVLALACGRATRLVRFLSGANKEYDATIQFGIETDTYDLRGTVTRLTERRPTTAAIAATVADMVGEQHQTPPAYSAKRIAGRRAYDLARQRTPVTPAPVLVRLSAAEVLEVTEDAVRLRLTCSAGFYVRSLAHDLGSRLSVGGCLAALRRTRSGQFTLANAVSLAEVQSGHLGDMSLSLEHLLPEFEAVVVSDGGSARFRHGQLLRPSDIVQPGDDRQVDCGENASPAWVRVLHPSQGLLGMARREPLTGALHPNIVLT